MRVALTGGTGFLGGALIRILRAKGDSVRALVRRPAAEDALRAAGAEPCLGDLARTESLHDFVSSGDVVIHSAARVNVVGSSEEYRRGTVETTRNLLETALPRRPARFVHISSAGVYSERDIARGACADRHPADPPPYNHYGRAKLASERLVRRLCNEAGCPWTILRMGFLYGPGNRALHEQLACFSAGRRVVLLIGRGQNHIATLYIDDAANAVRRAATHPAAPGRIYDLGNSERVTQERFIAEHLRVLQLPPPKHINKHLAYFGTCLAELGARVAGDSCEISRAMVRLMGAEQAIDARPIQREVDWHPEVDFTEGMRRISKSLAPPQSEPQA